MAAVAVLSPQIQREPKETELDYDQHLTVGPSRKRAKSYPDEESSMSLPGISSAAVSPSMSPPLRDDTEMEVHL